MAKIDILKHKLRYNKDLSYQLTGKDLKILIDYINNLEETITNNTISQLVQEDIVTVASDAFLIIDSTGVILKQETYDFIVLGITLNVGNSFSGSSERLIFNSSYLSPDQYLKLEAPVLLTPGTYLAEMLSMQKIKSLNLDIGAAPGDPQEVNFTITYLKLS